MNLFDDYFVFSNSEKKGIFIFVCILFLMSLIYPLMPYIFTKEKYDYSKFKEELAQKKLTSKNKDERTVMFLFNPNLISRDSLLLLGLTNKQSYNVINYRTKVGAFKSEKDFRKVYSISDSLGDKLAPFLVFDTPKKKAEHKSKLEKAASEDSLFAFDPNTATLAQLQQLGLSAKQSQTILNYKNKGGEFRSKEDFKKIYSISEKEYKRLESYVEIKKSKASKTETVINKVELNSATKSQLVAIRGIGDKTAERILKLRNRYGGYSSLNQLDEVYGLDSLIKENKVVYFDINLENISKININEVDFKKLLSHPYVDYNTTKKIINYREMHGEFTQLEQILENNLIKAEQYRKIAPYLTL